MKNSHRKWNAGFTQVLTENQHVLKIALNLESAGVS